MQSGKAPVVKAGESKQPGRFRRWVTPALFTLIGMGVVVGLLFGAVKATEVDRSSTCPPKSAGKLRVYTTGTAPVKLAPADKTLLLSFKESRRVLSKQALLFATPRLHQLASGSKPPQGARAFLIQAELEEELSGPNDATLTQLPGFSIGKQVTDAGNLRVCVQFDPAQLHKHELGGVSPGVYDGTLRISSPKVGTLEEYALHIRAAFRSSPWLAFAWVLAGFAFGVLVKMFSELAAGGPRGRSGALIAYMSQWSYLLAFFGGALTVALAYTQLYADGASWGSGDWDWLKLFGVCLTGQLSGTGVADLAKRAVDGKPTAV